MRFGVQWATAQTGPELADLARELEDLGYSSIAFPDHYSVHAGHGIVEPCIAMTYVAAVTTSLRVQQLVCNNDLRHPALFAWQMAHIDLLSGGRVEAGIGAGWNAPEYEALGIAFDRPGVRIARLTEAVDVIQQFWANPSVTFAGTYYNVDGLSGGPKGVQQPIPLLIGGNGTKTLTLGGRTAQIIGTGFSGDATDEQVTGRLDVARASAKASGRDPAEIEFQTMFTCGFDGADPGQFWPVSGDAEAMCNEFERRAALGVTYFSIAGADREKIRRFGREVVARLV